MQRPEKVRSARRRYAENSEVAVFELLPYLMVVHADLFRATIDTGILC